LDTLGYTVIEARNVDAQMIGTVIPTIGLPHVVRSRF
jgi:hypothetical protein